MPVVPGTQAPIHMQNMRAMSQTAPPMAMHPISRVLEVDLLRCKDHPLCHHGAVIQGRQVLPMVPTTRHRMGCSPWFLHQTSSSCR